MADEPEFIYVTTNGWKTSNPHRIEIWYVAHDGHYYILSEAGDRAHWVQNIVHDPAVTFQVGETTYQGTARVIDPAVEPELAASVSALMDQKYEWSDGLIVELVPELSRTM